MPLLDKLSVLFNLKDSSTEKREKFFKAVENERLAEIDTFIARDKDAVEWKDGEGVNALMTACKYGHREVIEKLLDAGADIDARDKASISAMGHAALMGQQNIVKMLIGLGADTRGTYEIARRIGKTGIMEMLDNAAAVKMEAKREQLDGRIEVMKALSLRQFKRA
ncbi:MAG: ankyrin repeat domain-containing protein [Alphaproteobacteria bacterium]